MYEETDRKTFFTQMLAERKKVCTFAALEPAKPLNDAQMCGSFYFYTYD